MDRWMPPLSCLVLSLALCFSFGSTLIYDLQTRLLIEQAHDRRKPRRDEDEENDGDDIMMMMIMQTRQRMLKTASGAAACTLLLALAGCILYSGDSHEWIMSNWQPAQFG